MSRSDGDEHTCRCRVGGQVLVRRKTSERMNVAAQLVGGGAGKVDDKDVVIAEEMRFIEVKHIHLRSSQCIWLI